MAASSLDLAQSVFIIQTEITTGCTLMKSSTLIHLMPMPLAATESCNGEIISAASTALFVSAVGCWPNGMYLMSTSLSVSPPASKTFTSS